MDEKGGKRGEGEGETQKDAPAAARGDIITRGEAEKSRLQPWIKNVVQHLAGALKAFI